MDKIPDLFKKAKDSWKNLSKAKKITIILISSVLILTLIILSFTYRKTAYTTLFSNLAPEDSAKVAQKLDDDKVKYKVEGDTILVPKDKVDKLRLSILSSDVIPPSHKGFELFDNTNKFGVTDTEAKVMYQRALSGELAKTIESIDGIEHATVNLVMPDDSVFATEKENASASILVKLKNGASLNPDQVKAIIALVSRGVKNLPKENVEIIDQNGNLLSEDVNDNSQAGGTVSSGKQLQQEKEFETRLQNDTKAMLEKIFGKDKVAVKVNANLDFNSRQTTTIKYDPKKVERSVQKSTESTKDASGAGNASSSPIDDNMSTPSQDNTNQNSETTHTEDTTNYEIPETKETVIAAPGEVKRMTVSVVIDGALNENEKDSIKNIVASATGFDEKRGDNINIESMLFNDEEQKNREKQAKDQLAAEEALQKRKMYAEYGAIGAAAALTLILILSSRKKKKEQEDMIALEEPAATAIDTVVGNEPQKPEVEYKPVLEEEEPMDIEKEIKNYAERKPDQVVELIKTWLAEDER